MTRTATPNPQALLRKAQQVLHAAQLQASALQKVPTPCQSVCFMSASQPWCEGCCRTLQEISAWSEMSVTEQLQVWVEIVRRVQSPPRPVSLWVRLVHFFK
jgi:predicted Fe-S protein YdhL (DUF1289 family)